MISFHALEDAFVRHFFRETHSEVSHLRSRTYVTGKSKTSTWLPLHKRWLPLGWGGLPQSPFAFSDATGGLRKRTIWFWIWLKLQSCWTITLDKPSIKAHHLYENFLNLWKTGRAWPCPDRTSLFTLPVTDEKFSNFECLIHLNPSKKKQRRAEEAARGSKERFEETRANNYCISI